MKNREYLIEQLKNPDFIDDRCGLMLEKTKAKFGIKIDKIWQGSWSFGVCLSHGFGETYLYINLFKWSISIGLLVLIDEVE